MDVQFGAVLKDWRGRRRMSQLGLGLAANVSARHIAFLETGRARPSRAMVLQLCEALDVPRPARNNLLGAAGFAPAYRSIGLDAAGMAHVRAAMDWTLDRHQPYPALALDRHWRIVKANGPAAALLSGVGLATGGSMLEAMTGPGRFWQAIENAGEVAAYMVQRLRTENAHLGGDSVLEAAIEALVARFGSHLPAGPLPPVVATRLRSPAGPLSFFSTIAQFGTAEDMALAELRIELFFPADQTTADALARAP